MDEWEFPKALYRSGGTELIWGKPVETLIVSSRGEEVEALAHGWCLHADKCDDLISAELIDPPKRQGRQAKVRAEHGDTD